MTDPFDIAFKDLPAEIPLFPLPRVILLPRVHLPLNIFEPRYLAMTATAMKNGRVIGMVQPRGQDGEVYATGCAGRNTAFRETEDGRYMITLKGLCRFDIRKELPQDAAGFRIAAADWSPYESDTAEDTSHDICRDTIMKTLLRYFDKMKMFCDKWEDMHHIPCEKLISTLSVVCPLGTADKQTLLEAKTLRDRAVVLQALLENAVQNCDNGNHSCH